jgi:hypothetical protein
LALQDARKEMDAGTWLCPHCYEDEHPEEGWMCNSSICMKRRGYKPTGIAIYDAQQRGFPSVAHWLQAQLRKRGGSSGKEAGAGAADKRSQADCSSGSAAAGAAAVEVDSSKRSSRGVSGSKASSSSASGDVQAPGTPVRDGVSAGVESAAAAAEPAAGGKGGRVTRRGGAAAAAAGFVAEGTEQEQSSKRVCVGDNAGTRRSLRFRAK